MLHPIPRLLLMFGLMLGTVLAQNTRSDASAQNTRNETVYLSMSLEQMLEFLDQSGFITESGTDDEGESYIDIKLGDFDSTLYLSDCKKGQCSTLELYWGMELEDVGLQAINQFNHSNLFVQAFLDEEEYPWLSSALDLTGGVTRKNIVNWINMFGQKLPDFAESMEEAEAQVGQGPELASASSIRMLLGISWVNGLPQRL
jgi:hypothetical protein